MDYWNPVLPDLRPVLTVVDPQREKLFLEALNASRIGYEIASSSFQEVVDEERAQMLIADRADFRNENFDYENRYHTYEQILQQIQFLANKCTVVFFFVAFLTFSLFCQIRAKPSTNQLE